MQKLRPDGLHNVVIRALAQSMTKESIEWQHFTTSPFQKLVRRKSEVRSW